MKKEKATEVANIFTDSNGKDTKRFRIKQTITALLKSGKQLTAIQINP